MHWVDRNRRDRRVGPPSTDIEIVHFQPQLTVNYLGPTFAPSLCESARLEFTYCARGKIESVTVWFGRWQMRRSLSTISVTGRASYHLCSLPVRTRTCSSVTSSRLPTLCLADHHPALDLMCSSGGFCRWSQPRRRRAKSVEHCPLTAFCKRSWTRNSTPQFNLFRSCQAVTGISADLPVFLRLSFLLERLAASTVYRSVAHSFWRGKSPQWKASG